MVVMPSQGGKGGRGSVISSTEFPGLGGAAAVARRGPIAGKTYLLKFVVVVASCSTF
jgi:hypothetical protein